MRTSILLAALLSTGCQQTDTNAAPTAIASLNVEGDVTLVSTLLNGEADEMSLNLDPIETVQWDGYDGFVHLRMLDDDGAENPNLVGVGRTSLLPMPGDYADIEEALDDWGSAAGYVRDLKVRTDLEPGTAFVIDQVSGSDFVALVVDRSIDVLGRCTDRASVTLILESIDAPD